MTTSDTPRPVSALIYSQWQPYADAAIVQPEAPGQRDLMQSAFYTAFVAGLTMADEAYRDLSEMERGRLFRQVFDEAVAFVRAQS